MLGLRLRGEELSMDPCIPENWPNFRIRYRHKSAVYDIVVENPSGVSQGVQKIAVDGKPLAPGQLIPLVDDGKTHSVQIMLGAETPLERESPLSH
jgi:cyclic beta-1,2-glucan synthetase